MTPSLRELHPFGSGDDLAGTILRAAPAAGHRALASLGAARSRRSLAAARPRSGRDPSRSALGAHLLRGLRRSRPAAACLLGDQRLARWGLERVPLRALSRGHATRGRARQRPSFVSNVRAAARSRVHRDVRPGSDARSSAAAARRRTRSRARSRRRRALVLGARVTRPRSPTSTVARASSSPADAEETGVKLGIDRLLGDAALRRELAGRRVALLAHPASMTGDFRHAVDALMALSRDAAGRGLRPAARHARREAGQHGGVGRTTWIPSHGIPVFSLYGDGPPADARDARQVRRAAVRRAGRRHARLHVPHHAALRAGGRRRGEEGRLGARPSQSRRPPGRGLDGFGPAARASSAPVRCRCATG